MRSFTLRGLTLSLPEAALKGNLERALSSGRYEHHEADALLLHLRPGDRLLDLGAGIGFICALAAGALGEAAVFGVEAGPETVKLARKNLAANGFPGVKLMRGAVVAKGEGEVEFGQRPAFWASALKGPEDWPENAEVIQVPARPIGKLLERFAPTVICCDIEGGEREVLAEPLPGVRLVVVETHPQVYGAAGVARIVAGLVAQGFEAEFEGRESRYARLQARSEGRRAGFGLTPRGLWPRLRPSQTDGLIASLPAFRTCSSHHSHDRRHRMYLTMNRFKVNAGQEEAFEKIWTGRESHLPQVPGFVSFHLFKGPEADGIRLYASHTMWDSEDAFKAWTRSEAFRSAHSGAGGHQGVMAGHPQLEVFESVQHIGA